MIRCRSRQNTIERSGRFGQGVGVRCRLCFKPPSSVRFAIADLAGGALRSPEAVHAQGEAGCHRSSCQEVPYSTNIVKSRGRRSATASRKRPTGGRSLLQQDRAKIWAGGAPDLIEGWIDAVGFAGVHLGADSSQVHPISGAVSYALSLTFCNVETHAAETGPDAFESVSVHTSGRALFKKRGRSVETSLNSLGHRQKTSSSH